MFRQLLHMLQRNNKQESRAAARKPRDAASVLSFEVRQQHSPQV